MGRLNPREPPRWPSCVEAVVSGSLSPSPPWVEPLASLSTHMGRRQAVPEEKGAREEGDRSGEGCPGNLLKVPGPGRRWRDAWRSSGPRAPTRRPWAGLHPSSFLGPAAPPAGQAWTLARWAEVEPRHPACPVQALSRTYDPGRRPVGLFQKWFPLRGQ